jgi:hypothetical protein
MNRALLAVAAMTVAGAAMGQGSAVYLPVKSVKDQGITLAGWGSGTIAETDETKFEGAYSLRITTRNLFQGGLIRLSSPADLASAYADKNNLLRIAVRVADMNMTMSGGGGKPGPDKGGGGIEMGGAGGNMAPPTGGGSKQQPPTGGGNQGMLPGGNSKGSQGNPPAANIPPLRMLRFVVTTTDGLKSEAYVPLNTNSNGAAGWRMIAIPLASINGFERTNKIIKEVGVSGDTLATFYIGEMRVLNDATPITGDVNVKTMNLALGDEREFRATGFGGASVLRYTWDFDARDGIQVDAEGPVVKRKFRKPGEYTITMTVSDAAGLKKPAVSTIKVKVNP